VACLPNKFEDIDIMFLSSKAKLLLLSAVLILGSKQVIAQEIKSATFASPQASMGNAVDMTIVFQSTGAAPWCGLLIEWGDGDKQEVRIGNDNLKTSPITLSHKYSTAGTFNVSVKGSTVVRGLKTAYPCSGAVKPASIMIVDMVAMQNAERQKQAADKEKALAEEAERSRRAASDEAERSRRAASDEAERSRRAALDEADRSKKALEAKELEMKRRELDMKEEMLKREEEMRKREEEARKKSQQQRPPAPAPVATPAPAPAPAGGKPPVKPASGF